VHLLRMTIRNLRQKLEAVAPGETYIATEYGLGYRLTGASTQIERGSMGASGASWRHPTFSLVSGSSCDMHRHVRSKINVSTYLRRSWPPREPTRHGQSTHI